MEKIARYDFQRFDFDEDGEGHEPTPDGRYMLVAECERVVTEERSKSMEVIEALNRDLIKAKSALAAQRQAFNERVEALAREWRDTWASLEREYRSRVPDEYLTLLGDIWHGHAAELRKLKVGEK